MNGNAIISEQLFVGGSSGSSNLTIQGTIGYGFQTVSSNTLLTNASIVLADSSSDNLILTLPYAGNVIGRQIQIKKTSTLNSIRILGGGNLIDDTSPIELPVSNNLPSVELISDGRQWYITQEKHLTDTVASDNLIAWWKLDETSVSANISDSSQNSFEGSHQGTMTTGDVVSSPFLNALDFDGVNDFIHIDENSTTLHLTKGTLSAWIKTSDAGSNYRGILVKGSAYGMFLNNNELGLFDWDTTTWRGSGINPNDGEWHLITVSINAGVASGSSFYLDGQFISSTTMDILNQTTEVQIGCNSSITNQCFAGQIDDARIYDRILTPSEIMALYHQNQ